MKWELIEPVFGDMVRVRTGNIYHYGVFASEDEVLQFGYNPALRGMASDGDVEVIATSVEQFLAGGFLETAIWDRKEIKRRASPKETVDRARSRLGERGYHILHNNCEHFANQCVFGEAKSSQTDEARAFFRAVPVVEVYVAAIGDRTPQRVHPPQRNEEIVSCQNESVKRQKYAVWKLLEYALFHSFGLKISELAFSKTLNGKWLCKECYFSLTHTDDAVAVAVSRAPVGVDMEKLQPLKVNGLENKILTRAERAAFDELSASDEKTRRLLSAWTAKEARFKQSDDAAFRPSEIDGTMGVKTQSVFILGEEYLLSAASENLSRLKLKQVVDWE